MILIISKYIVPNGFSGFTIFPFVFLKYKEDKGNTLLINHEKIHIRQQIELLILPFFIWYVVEFILNLMVYKNTRLAYRNISFEREAYFFENDLKYLKKRPFWAFTAFR